MRLAYIVGMYPLPSESFIRREVDGMRAHGHQVDVFSLFVPPSGAEIDVEYGWTGLLHTVHRKSNKNHAITVLARRWELIFTARKYDAIIAHFASLPSTVALQAAGTIPLILSIHARDLYVEAEFLDEKMQRADAVVTCTQANIGFLHDFYPSYDEKVHLIYHGLPHHWLATPLPTRIRPEEDDALRLLAVGRFVEKKGFHILLAACALLHENGFPFTLRLVGDGPYRERLSRQCETLHLQNVVTLAGWLHEEELRAAYEWADVFCCPSVVAADGDCDGLPNVVIEAMASGLPLIASDLSGIPEAMMNGSSGLLVPAKNAQAFSIAISCCADPEIRVEFGTCGAQIARTRFDAEYWITQYDLLLQRCVIDKETAVDV